ncbi:hypothetical protein [Clostridium sp. D53t1_180928_C8]|uniref:hypothetical protein n=1 Tax=Clostridium sp. D53t1_180928_C8 TaxID=2787101 RepID=UPI0018A9E055|nr:hypothetical protein [Clostridium sp. D53t1_180928_C8]
MIDKYRSVSEEILKIVSSKEVNDYRLKEKLKERQAIIDGLEEEKLRLFRDKYKNCGLYELDKEISIMLVEKIKAVKKELDDYSTKKLVNTAYVNANRNSLNIFYKKV